MIAIDTNLLVYAHRAGLLEHRAARRAIEHAAADPRGWGIPAPCLAELWGVVTHPACAGRPSAPNEVVRFLRGLIEDGGALVWSPRDGFHARLLIEAERLAVRGPRVFDLQIALVAAEAGATEIWSHDRSFLAPAGVRVHDPL